MSNGTSLIVLLNYLFFNTHFLKHFSLKKNRFRNGLLNLLRGETHHCTLRIV